MVDKWTPNQKQAIQARGNAVVTAGAGAGKTLVLVEHYYHVLVEAHPDWPIESVVTVTFTRKAAAEMLARVRRKFDEVLAAPGTAPSTRQRVQELRERLSLAPIGTIHAFCARLLRKYYFECQCDPEFEVLEAIVYDQLVDECIEATFNEWKRMETEDQRVRAQKLLRLMSVFGNRSRRSRGDSLRKVLAEMLANRYTFEPVAQRYLAGDEAALAQTIQQFLQALPPEELPESDKSEASQEEQEALRIEREAEATATVLHPLAELYLAVLEEFRRRCSAATNARRTDLMDYAELELRVRNLLLENPQFRQRVYEDIHHLIVDEFQDTSQVQWEIFKSLICDAQGALAPERFFAVGDFKQSIYGFRQADLRVLQEAKELVSQDPDRQCISLNECFRMAPEPLRTVNRLFANLWEQYAEKTGIDPADLPVFEPLVGVRNETPGSACRIHVRVIADKRPTAAVRRQGEAAVVAETIRWLCGADGGQKLHEPGEIAILVRKRELFGGFEAALRELQIPYLTVAGGGLFARPEVRDVVGVLQAAFDPYDDFALLAFLRGSLINCSDELLLKISLEKDGFARRHLWTRCRTALEENAGPSGVPLTAIEADQLRFAVELLNEIHAHLGLVPIDELLQKVVERTAALEIWRRCPDGGQAVANIQRLLHIARQHRTSDLESFLEFAERQVDAREGEEESMLEAAAAGAVKIMTIHAAKGLEFPVVFVAGLSENWSGRQDTILCDGKWFAVSKPTQTGAKPMLFEYLEKLERVRELSEELRVLYVAATRCRDRLFLCSSDAEVERSPSGKSSGTKNTSTSSRTKKEDTTFAAFLCRALDTRRQEEVEVDGLTGALSHALGETACSSSDAGVPAIYVRWQDETRASMRRAERQTNESGMDRVPITTPDFEAAVLEKERFLREEFGLTEVRQDEGATQDAGAICGPTYDVPPFAPAIVGRPVHRDLFVTALLDFWECPLLFFRRRVLEIEDLPATEATRKGELSGAARGQLMHEAIERLLQGKENLGTYLTERIVEVAPLEIEKARELAADFVSSIERAQALGLFREIEEAAEKRFETAYTICEENFLITARFDCEYVTQDGRVEIADFKTDTKLDDAGLNRYHKQMMLYLLVLSRFRPEQSLYRARLIFTQLGRCEVIEATAKELEEFCCSLRELLAEYARFSERFCRGDVVFDDQLVEALREWCRQRSAPCLEHLQVEKVGEHA